MGKKDMALARYFEEDERYAELLNGFIFKGRQVVRPEHLAEAGETVTGVARRSGKSRPVHKYRDLMRRVAFGTDFVLIGLENQDRIHYAMPVRIMVEDALNYDQQLRRLQREHRRQKDLRGDEFVSGCSADDRLRPVVSIVLYYGIKPWEASEDLYELLEQERLPEPLRALINHYRIHVLDIGRYADLGHFCSDLHEVFGFLQNAGNKDRERQFTSEYASRFEEMSEDAYNVIAQLTDSKELEEVKERCRGKGGKINMCKAIQGMIEDGKREGVEQGIRILVESCQDFHISMEHTIRQLSDKFSLSREEAEERTARYWK